MDITETAEPKITKDTPKIAMPNMIPPSVYEKHRDRLDPVIPRLSSEKSPDIIKGFVDFALHLEDREEKLRQTYHDEIKEPPIGKQLIEPKLLEQSELTHNMWTTDKSYQIIRCIVFAQIHKLPKIFYYPDELPDNLRDAFKEFASQDSSEFRSTYAATLEKLVGDTLNASHDPIIRREANDRNVKELENVAIQAGDLLHGTPVGNLQNILANGLWCTELANTGAYGNRANYFVESFGKVIPGFGKDFMTVLREINPLILAVFYRRLNETMDLYTDNTGFFARYHGNMASHYGPFERNLQELRAALPQGVDDRKIADEAGGESGITLIFRPQNETYKGRGFMPERMSEEVVIPLGVSASEIKGIVVNGLNMEETKETLEMVKQNDFYIPVYDCVTGQVLNPTLP